VTGAVEGFETLCGSGEEEATAAAYVEDLLVAAPGVEVEHEVAVSEFAYFDVEKEEEAFCDEKACGP
jgi:hypothetical protein